MHLKVGCDLINIEKFKKIIENQNVLKKIFTLHEIINSHSLENLAGKFAAKEAVIKALQIDPGNWHNIEIIKLENGKPIAKINYCDRNIISHDLSISHDGEYVLAFTCFLINDFK